MAMTATAPAVPDSPSPTISAAALIPRRWPAARWRSPWASTAAHDATGARIFDLGFSSLAAMKSWLATIAVSLALVQLVSRWPCSAGCPSSTSRPAGCRSPTAGPARPRVPRLPPVAYHCLWSLGFETTSPRVVIHGIAGCLFYGAFTTKLLALRSRRLPGWALPVIGGTLVAGLVDHLDDVGAVVLPAPVDFAGYH